MTTTTVEIPTSVVDAVRTAIAARDAAMAMAEDAADVKGINYAVIDEAIDAFAAGGKPFSANDLRHLLPEDLPGSLMGSRFQHAANNRKVIRFCGYVTSTKKNTHAKPVGLWRGIPQAFDA